MKINGFSNIQKIMKTYGKSSTENVKGNKIESDKIEISQAGRDYQFAMEAIGKLPEIRSEKVEAIKVDVQSGTYKVDKEKIAQNIFESAVKDVKL
ncbi:anti-sigma-28 factor, FlgM family [Peptoclostridium litorale DSM 5388]|uniref:Negative regulator of flagellin synthesis n=1 Tax=Peptoclostridium litorale DSM 5388 TaxID=1121324 RepID=A0A069RCH5_PEPLI|nr:flagellar biosynthesis anti-sigma factor FlgM [Peptoclostridium litorale]KDR94754.1 hypothetical protein CLIT_13c00760 [Peptoclostridium litorale DSM 5388]SIN91953.1 anti-sigma-28 factor, FlgM family [Peptoclostridium litorale DSM 5388]